MSKLGIRLKLNEIKKIFENPWNYFPIISIFLFVPYVFDWYGQEPSSESLIKTIVLFVTQSIAVIIVISIFLKLKFTDSIDKISSALEVTHMNWLLSEAEVEKIEKNSSGVWIFTPELKNDIDDTGKIFKAIYKNLSSGKKYDYFVPNTKTVKSQVKTFKELFSDYVEQVSFVFVPENDFFIYTEVAVYNADSDEENIALEWLPVDDFNYYIRLDKKHTSDIAGIGCVMREKYGSKKL